MTSLPIQHPELAPQRDIPGEHKLGLFLQRERARHVLIAAGANSAVPIASGQAGRAWRVHALALTASGDCVVALQDGAEVIARWHLAAGVPLVLSGVAVGWAQGSSLTVHVMGAEVSGTATLISCKAEPSTEAAPAAPEQPEPTLSEIEAELERVGYAASVDPRRLDEQGKRAHLRQRRRDLAEEQARAARRESADAWVREHHPGRLERAP